MEAGSTPRGERVALHAALAVLLAGAGVVAVVWRPLAPRPTPPPNDLDEFSPVVLEVIEGYRRPRRAATVLALGLAVAVPAAAVTSRPGRRTLLRLAGPRPHAPLRGAVVAATLIAAADVIIFPVSFAVGYLQDGAYGFRTASLAGWLRDWVVSHGLGWLLAGLGGATLAAALGRWPRSWHWRAVPVGTAGVAALVLLAPLVYEPLLMPTEPLEPGATRRAIEQVLARAGEADAAILVGQASRRTTKVNAYVSGLGPSRRVVLFDTLLALPPDVVAHIVAHELAHRRHHDIVRGVLLTASGILPLAWLAHRAIGSSWARRALRPRSRSDPRLVGLGVALAALGAAAALPAANLVSRRAEAAADHRALQLTSDPATFIQLERLVVLRDLADPHPPAWYQAVFGSHPSPTARIRAAVDYATRLGLPLPERADLLADQDEQRHPRLPPLEG